jgi:hypothetical protein
MWFVSGADDDGTCAFSRGCCEVNGTAVKVVLNIVKTNIPLRFKGNIINFYFYYFKICWFTRSDREKHWNTPIGLRSCHKNNCAI